ncbi:MAG: hypothetical protein GY757_49370, partial [bacterium]|nr:hypothetical protein [bacterium]
MVEIENPNKEIDIDKFLNLCHVPEAKETLLLQIEKIRVGPINERIDAYYQRKQEYKAALLGEVLPPVVAHMKTTTQAIPYWFEISRLLEGKWDIFTIEPKPISRSRRNELLPPDVVEVIAAESLVDIETVVTKKRVVSLATSRCFDLKFVRASSNHIYGIVVENRESSDKMRDSSVRANLMKDDEIENMFLGHMEEAKTSAFMKHLFRDAYCKYVLPMLAHVGDFGKTCDDLFDRAKREEIRQKLEAELARREKKKTPT